MKFGREVACLVEAVEPKCFQDTVTHELDVCARRRTRATRPLPRRDGQERGDASGPTPDKFIATKISEYSDKISFALYSVLNLSGVGRKQSCWQYTTAFLTGA